MHILFAIPGRSFSRKFLLSWMDLVHYCYKMKYNQRLHTVDSSNIFQARDALLSNHSHREGFQSPYDGIYDYICMIDSDQTFTVKDFERLLSLQEDIVCGWSYAGVNDENEPLASFGFLEDRWQPCPQVKISDIEKLPQNEKGLIEVDFTGLPFALIKKGVFEKIEYPWFSIGVNYMKKIIEKESGKIFTRSISEDVLFSMKLKDVGFKIVVDPTVRVGHEKLVVL